jgi:hypothetical protein
MSRESEIATLLLADAPLVAILTGGIYTDEELGVEGIRRGDGSPTENAFDTDGVLKPMAVVRQRGENPYSDVRFQRDKITATSQVVMVYFYEFRGHSEIEAAANRTYEILEGERLERSYPLVWLGDSPPFPDTGPVTNSTSVFQEWQIITLKRPS